MTLIAWAIVLVCLGIVMASDVPTSAMVECLILALVLALIWSTAKGDKDE